MVMISLKVRPMPNRMTSVLVVLALLPSAVSAQDRKKKQTYPPKLAGATFEVYKKAGDATLNRSIFNPDDHKPTDARAVVVFFCGGGWKSGTPKQVAQHRKYFASRGMVAMRAGFEQILPHM